MTKNKIAKLADYSVILIALLALVVSMWQVKLFQNHNKLTVKPYLDFHILQEDSTLAVAFSNKGLGPAIIENISYEMKQKKYASIYELLKTSGEEKNMISTFNYPKNTVVSTGEKKLLTKLVENKARGIRVKIIYKSIYQERGVLEFSF